MSWPMRRLSVVLAAALSASGSLLSACSSVTQIEDTTPYSTLTVAYGATGNTPSPCDDRLPMVDGVAEDQEWDGAEPLYLRMTGANGTGGDDYVVELRAVWTDEGKFSGGTDRLYFMLRYADDDLDNQPDLLAYATRDPVTGDLVPSRMPEEDTSVNPPEPDSVIVRPESWTRINPDGREDQIVFTLAADAETNPIDLLAASRAILRTVGKSTPAATPIPGAQNLDVWVWRAGRTNPHPVPQFSRWDVYAPGEANPANGECDVPEPEVTRFPNVSGFCEDFWIGADQVLRVDAGRSPFIRNFAGRDPIPDRITQPIPSGRDPGDETLVINCSLAKDIILWWHTAVVFKVTNTIATSRIGSIQWRWSERLLPGEYDKIQGWGIQTPTESARDVRARAIFEENQEKGFPVRTLEVMRQLATGNGDDLRIEPGKRYRLVLGIYDASGSTASGSSEIEIVFEPPSTTGDRPRSRC